MNSRVRLDKALKDLGYVTSRSKAQNLILKEGVEVCVNGQWTTVYDANYPVIPSSNSIRLLSTETLKYVSRGGLKLEGALAYLGKNVKGLRALDIGLSTGGFTDCLLQAGAAQVIGVDVGKEQLDTSLKQHPGLLAFDGMNARHLIDYPEMQIWKAKIDFIVIDVSFISLTYIFPNLKHFLVKQGEVLALVKPQFELNRDRLDKKGVVKDAKDYDQVQSKVEACATKEGFYINDYFSSNELGRDGNKEFFIYAHI